MRLSPFAVMPARAQRNRARGFTLIELIAVIVILGSLSAVAVPTLLDMRTAARDAVVQQAAAALHAGLTNARMAWRLRGTGGATTNLGGYLQGDVDFSANGFVTGTTYAGGALSHENCAESWRVAFQNGPAVAAFGGPLPPNGFRAMYIANIGCVFGLLDASGNMVDDGTGLDGLYIGYDPLGIFVDGGLIPGQIWARRHITMYAPMLQFYGTPR